MVRIRSIWYPLRLLLDDQGQVVDRSGMPRDRTRFEAACEALRGWKFRPAHWGNLPSPRT